MKKFTVLCVFTMLLLTACNQANPTPTQEPGTTTPEVQTNKTAEPKVEGSALTKTSEDDTYVHYSGNITIKGTYSESINTPFLGDTLCFYADKETGYLIPRDPNLYGENNGDNRAPWFCFKNQQEAKDMFGINDSEVFKNSVECIEGTAEIEISEYTVNKMEAEVWDTAKLEKVISKEPFSTDCKN